MFQQARMLKNHTQQYSTCAFWLQCTHTSAPWFESPSNPKLRAHIHKQTIVPSGPESKWGQAHRRNTTKLERRTRNAAQIAKSIHHHMRQYSSSRAHPNSNKSPTRAPLTAKTALYSTHIHGRHLPEDAQAILNFQQKSVVLVYKCV